MGHEDHRAAEWDHFERIYEWAVLVATRQLQQECAIKPTILFARMRNGRIERLGMITTLDGDADHSGDENMMNMMDEVVDLPHIDVAVQVGLAKERRTIASSSAVDVDVVMFRFVAKHYELTALCDRLAGQPWLVRHPLEKGLVVMRQQRTPTH